MPIPALQTAALWLADARGGALQELPGPAPALALLGHLSWEGLATLHRCRPRFCLSWETDNYHVITMIVGSFPNQVIVFVYALINI